MKINVSYQPTIPKPVSCSADFKFGIKDKNLKEPFILFKNKADAKDYMNFVIQEFYNVSDSYEIVELL